MNTRCRTAFAAALVVGALASGALAQEPVKIGFILPMTGPQQSTGRQIAAAIRLFMQQNGDTVAGRKIELIIKDDGAAPDTSKRLAQELIVNSKVQILAGFGVTPAALAVAPIATQAKIPMVVTAAGSSIITERSPYVVRTSFTLAQSTVAMGAWAAQNGIKTIVFMGTDFSPTTEAEIPFKAAFERHGGKEIQSLRFPLANPDFAPFLQRAKDAKPDAIFVFVPSGQGAAFVRQYLERGLDKAGIRLIGPGDVTDDDLLNGMGDQVIGTVTAHFYSADHDSPTNKAFVAAFRKVNDGMRPNFMAVGGYDGMHLIYEALRKTGGNTDGDTFIAAAKGMTWESPRGPILIDTDTRDIIQNVYMRKVEKKNGELYNVEFSTVEAVKDPIKAARK